MPTRVLNRIEPAGQSAYRWCDESLVAYLSPTGRVVRLCRALTMVGRVTLSVAVLVAGLIGGQGFWTTVVLLAGRFGWLSTPFAGLILTLLVRSTYLSGVGETAAVVGWVGLLFITPHRHRRGITTIGLVGAVVGAAVPPQWALAVTAVTLTAGGGWLWFVGGRAFPRRGGWLWGCLGGQMNGTPGILHGPPPVLWGGRAAELTNPPPPPCGVPWFLRITPKGRRAVTALSTGTGLDPALRETARKRVGADTERRTALLLLGLRRGARIIHDVALPGADNANIDHLVVTTRGVFALDTKRFGTVNDPGQVIIDNDVLVHSNNTGRRDLTPSIRSLNWAARAVGETVGCPVTPVLVVHNAGVPPNIPLVDGVAVVPPERLLSLLEDQPTPFGGLNRGQITQIGLRARQQLRAAGTKQRPRVVHPLRLVGSPREVWHQPPTLPDTSPPQQEHVVARGEVARTLRGTVKAAADSQWAAMNSSPQAPPDDVEPKFRGVRRGTPLTVTTEDGVWSVVAMTGPCQGPPGNAPYVWAATLGDYDRFNRSGQVVAVQTVPLTPQVGVTSPR